MIPRIRMAIDYFPKFGCCVFFYWHHLGICAAEVSPTDTILILNIIDCLESHITTNSYYIFIELKYPITMQYKWMNLYFIQPLIYLFDKYELSCLCYKFCLTLGVYAAHSLVERLTVHQLK